MFLEEVQQALTVVVNVPLKEDVNTQTKICEVNTQNILFIAGGAFDGIEKLFLND
jgi:ATP-dependent protease Clp ATPase subunit